MQTISNLRARLELKHPHVHNQSQQKKYTGVDITSHAIKLDMNARLEYIPIKNAIVLQMTGNKKRPRFPPLGDGSITGVTEANRNHPIQNNIAPRTPAPNASKEGARGSWIIGGLGSSGTRMVPQSAQQLIPGTYSALHCGHQGIVLTSCR